ncbi:MAG TPA: carboxypeptidase-like regulatory domain-containing protein [Bacteroidales bacterium]|nr:carboxypeptidase-like regulatory domain-containing protein [Bacteroidales bacterium]
MKNNLSILLKSVVLSIIVMFLFFVSCKEEEVNSFSGTVYDMSSGDAVEGVKVYLDASKVSASSINSAFVQLAETTTDASGKYFLECENDTYLKFRLRFEKDDFHSSSNEITPQDYAWDYTFEKYFARESFIFVRILNILPNDDADEFKIKIVGINELCTECGSGSFKYYYGSFVDTSFQCKTVGGDSILIYSISIHDDESIIKENKVFCIPGDTVFYNCYY